MDIRKARIEDKDEIFVLLNQLYENKIKYMKQNGIMKAHTILLQ